jgi:hypothetical protein
MNSVMKLLFDAVENGDEQEREALSEMVHGTEEYFADFICGLGFLKQAEKDILEKNYPKFFFVEEMKVI